MELTVVRKRFVWGKVRFAVDRVVTLEYVVQMDASEFIALCCSKSTRKYIYAYTIMSAVCLRFETEIRSWDASRSSFRPLAYVCRTRAE